jgi:hypothetical protein
MHPVSHCKAVVYRIYFAYLYSQALVAADVSEEVPPDDVAIPVQDEEVRAQRGIGKAGILTVVFDIATNGFWRIVLGVGPLGEPDLPGLD